MSVGQGTQSIGPRAGSQWWQVVLKQEDGGGLGGARGEGGGCARPLHQMRNQSPERAFSSLGRRCAPQLAASEPQPGYNPLAQP